MTEFETAAIYTDLDTIFDTRLAVLHQFGIETVENVMKGGYFDRISEEFETVDTEAFKERYNTRDLKTLEQALVTPAVEIINQFAKQTLVALVSSPFQRQPKVVVNIYPYVISEEVQKWMIIGLKAVTEKLIDIEMVSIPLEDLTPQYVKDNFVMMVMYHYLTWLDIHSANKNLVNVQCPMVSLIGPDLLKSKEVAKVLKVEEAREAVEKHASLFIKLSLYPIRMFCVDMDRFKRKAKKVDA